MTEARGELMPMLRSYIVTGSIFSVELVLLGSFFFFFFKCHIYLVKVFGFNLHVINDLLFGSLIDSREIKLLVSGPRQLRNWKNRHDKE